MEALFAKYNIELTDDVEEAKEYFDSLPKETIPTLKKFLLSPKSELLIIHGDGNNGKTAFVRMLDKITDQQLLPITETKDKEIIVIDEPKTQNDLSEIMEILLKKNLKVIYVTNSLPMIPNNFKSMILHFQTRFTYNQPTSYSLNDLWTTKNNQIFSLFAKIE